MQPGEGQGFSIVRLKSDWYFTDQSRKNRDEEGKNYCKTEHQRTGKIFSWCYFRNRAHNSQMHNLTGSLLLKQSPGTKYMDLHLKQYLGLLSPINKNRFMLQEYCKKMHNHLPNSTKLSKIPRKPCCTVLWWLAAACYFQCNLYQLLKVKNGCILYKWFKTEGIPHADF